VVSFEPDDIPKQERAAWNHKSEETRILLYMARFANVCDEGGYLEQFDQVNLDEDRKDGMVTEMN
jgi:hypothetical protein